MKVRNLLIPLAVIIFVMAGAASVSGQTNWVRLGQKDVDFNADHDTIGAESKGRIREVYLKVAKAPIKFTKVVINYKDGTKQELEYLENVQVGHDSRSISIEGDGHVIKTIDLWYETDSLGGKKAKVTVYGRA